MSWSGGEEHWRKHPTERKREVKRSGEWIALNWKGRATAAATNCTNYKNHHQARAGNRFLFLISETEINITIDGHLMLAQHPFVYQIINHIPTSSILHLALVLPLSPLLVKKKNPWKRRAGKSLIQLFQSFILTPNAKINISNHRIQNY